MNKTHAAIDEAFCALLEHNFEAARKALARAQCEHYGMRPWFMGAPEEDALGNRIVYKDGDGQGRYSVREIRPDGSHVRVLLGDARYIGPNTTFEARGPEASKAREVAEAYAATLSLREPARATSSMTLQNDWVAIRYQTASPPLD